VTSISISEKYQGMGYGKYLFQKLFAQAKCDEVKSVRLEVKHYNERALSFYNSLNFVVISKQNLNLVLEKTL
jgi:ribosomal protein S18 acetylase RimI-like enzyme